MTEWLSVINGAGVTIPPFAALKIIAMTVTPADEPVASVGPPDADGSLEVLFNGPSQIAVGAFGQARRGYPCPASVAVVSGDGDLTGRIVGTLAGSFSLVSSRTGFACMSDARGGVANVVPQTTTQTCYVMVTSDTPVAGLWPAKKMVYNPDTNSLSTGADIWYFDPNR